MHTSSTSQSTVKSVIADQQSLYRFILQCHQLNCCVGYRHPPNHGTHLGASHCGVREDDEDDP